MSTFDDPPPSYGQQQQQQLAWALPAAPMAAPAYQHSPQVPLHYGSLPQQLPAYATSLPRAPPPGARPNSSIDFGGYSYRGPAVPERPATSGAVYRSTAEWGQLSGAEKDQAQVWLGCAGRGLEVGLGGEALWAGINAVDHFTCLQVSPEEAGTPTSPCSHTLQRNLMATLQEDELFDAASEPGSASMSAAGGPSAAHPNSPAISLDSFQSAPRHGGGSRHAAQPASPQGQHPPYPGQLDESGPLPAWWGADSPRAQQAASPPQQGAAWAHGDPSTFPAHPGQLPPVTPPFAAEAAESHWAPGTAPTPAAAPPYPHDFKTSPQRLETASFTRRGTPAGTGGSWGPPADSMASGSHSSSSPGSGPFAIRQTMCAAGGPAATARMLQSSL